MVKIPSKRRRPGFEPGPVLILIMVAAAVAMPMAITDLDPSAMLLDLDQMAMAVVVTMTIAMAVAVAIEAITDTKSYMAGLVARFSWCGCTTQPERQRAGCGDCDERFLQHVSILSHMNPRRPGGGLCRLHSAE
jgi:hypothetical protein